MSAVYETWDFTTEFFFQFLGTDMTKERYVQEKKVSGGTNHVQKYMAESTKTSRDYTAEPSERTRVNWYKVKYRKYF